MDAPDNMLRAELTADNRPTDDAVVETTTLATADDKAESTIAAGTESSRECRAGAGLSEAALESLLLENGPMLHRYVNARIPRKLRSSIAPEDVIQEVWIAAFKGRHGFRDLGDHSFERWIVTIAGHKLVDFLKAAFALKRFGTTAVGQDPMDRSSTAIMPMGTLPDGHHTPSGEISVRESVEAIRRALTGLADDRARAIRLRHIEGLSLSQIAAAMGKTINAVSSLLFHGRRDLKKRMGNATLYFSDADSNDNADTYAAFGE